MKKTFLTSLMCSILILTLTGCGEDNNDQAFSGKVVEVAASYMIVEPNKNEKERKSSEKIRIDLESDSVTYDVGDTVKINYTGDIKESNPSQLEITQIELKSVKDFKLLFSQESNDEKKQIVDKTANANYDYNVYIHDGNFKIIIKNKIYTLDDAIKKKKITVEKIIEKAKDTCQEPIVYNDGGSREYHCNNYTIIKLNTLEEKKDVYFGGKDLMLSDVKK